MLALYPARALPYSSTSLRPDCLCSQRIRAAASAIADAFRSNTQSSPTVSECLYGSYDLVSRLPHSSSIILCISFPLAAIYLVLKFNALGFQPIFAMTDGSVSSFSIEKMQGPIGS